MTTAGALLKNIEYHGKKNFKLITNFLVADPNRDNKVMFETYFLVQYSAFLETQNYNHTSDTLYFIVKKLGY